MPRPSYPPFRKPSSGSREEGAGAPGEALVAGGEDAPVGGEVERLAAPIGDRAARALDHRRERAKIIGLQIRLGDEIDETAGEERIGIAIGAEAGERHAAAE